MSIHSRILMTACKRLVTIGILAWWVSANGDEAENRNEQVGEDRLAEQLVCRSMSVEGVVSFSDFPGVCAEGGDAVTISVSVPRTADIELHKEQYEQILDLLDRMAEDRQRRDLVSIERRQVNLEYELAQIQLDLAHQYESETQYVRLLPGYMPYGFPRRPHPFRQHHVKNSSNQNHFNHRSPRDHNSQALSITPGIFKRPIQGYPTVQGRRRF